MLVGTENKIGGMVITSGSPSRRRLRFVSCSEEESSVSTTDRVAPYTRAIKSGLEVFTCISPVPSRATHDLARKTVRLDNEIVYSSNLKRK